MCAMCHKPYLNVPPSILRQNQGYLNLQSRLKAKVVLAWAAPSPNQLPFGEHSEDQASHVSMFLSNSFSPLAHEANSSLPTVSQSPGAHLPSTPCLSQHSHICSVSIQIPNLWSLSKRKLREVEPPSWAKTYKQILWGALQAPVRMEKWRKPLLCAWCHRVLCLPNLIHPHNTSMWHAQYHLPFTNVETEAQKV